MDLAEQLAAALPERYRLIREIGRGGAARVYLAQESHPQREVAIKVLEPSVAQGVGAERFLREVDFASKLSHPHILPVFTAGEANGLLYYVMPYVQGETLRHRLARERRLPTAEALQITREVADALSYAHGRDIVHRDIKPENILLHAGHAVVADFGIARAVASSGEETLTGAGYAVGTPAYMSPEQASGAEHLDGRSDVYSLGCVLYEMLTGETPHLGATVDALIAKKLHAPVPAVSLLRPTVSADLEATVAAALERTPADRYQSAAEFRDTIGAMLTPSSTAITVPPGQPLRTPRGATVTTPGARTGRTPTRSAPLPWTRSSLTMVLGGLLALNWAQTTFDNWLAARFDTVRDLRHELGHAMQWLEGGLRFVGHDIANNVTAYGYTAVYFFVFPALVLAVAAALARQPNLAGYRLFVTAAAADYAITLPFYLLFPVPERWSFPESGAVLLSDRWSSALIELIRPMSGLDNCFPSFHASLTAIAVLVAFIAGLRFRWVALCAGVAIVASTIVLGFHWTADVIAGLAVATISVSIARRLVGMPAPWRGLATPARVGMMLLVAVVTPRMAEAQASVSFIGVVPDAEYRRADERLRRYLEESSGVRFVAEQPHDYRNVIDRLVDATGSGTPLVARVTPYALVAAEMLGARASVLATYVSRATGGTTYHSYLVLGRDRYPGAMDLDQVLRSLRGERTPPTFAFHDEFSTSSYFLPAMAFRRSHIFDMPAATDRTGAIRARRLEGGTTDLVKGVAEGRHDLAAVWSGTRAAFERADSLATYARRVRFVELPNPVPNDLLVATDGVDAATLERLRGAIKAMRADEIGVGDFVTWRDLSEADDARQALAELRWLAREAPAPATVDIRRAEGGGAALPEAYVAAAREAVRLAGMELVNFDRDYHTQQDYVWSLEPMHDGALRLRSRIVGADGMEQEFQLNFRTPDELTARIVDLMRTRLHRVRYVWPYRADPPTVLRDVDFGVAPGSPVAVRKIRWLDLQRHAYSQDAAKTATVARTDFHKLELAPQFIDPPDRDGFGFSPMSNISYRVILARGAHEQPIYRVLAAALVLLLVLGAVAAAADLRRGLQLKGHQFRAGAE